MELISKQAAIIQLSHNKNKGDDEWELAVENDIQTIWKLPLVEPKRIKGKWVGTDTQCGIVCSVCGVAVDDFCHSADYMDLDYEPNFCPNCGANMKG